MQSWGNVEPILLDSIEKAIIETYRFKVVRLPRQSFPTGFFVNIKTSRYRADSIINYIKNHKADSLRLVLGVTEKDISVTKKDPSGEIKLPHATYSDWGVFGYGYRPGTSCVLSTFRLKGKNKRETLLRIKKVALHEIGHNLGLKHCEESNDCVMRDAAEKISTIDNVQPKLCNYFQQNAR